MLETSLCIYNTEEKAPECASSHKYERKCSTLNFMNGENVTQCISVVKIISYVGTFVFDQKSKLCSLTCTREKAQHNAFLAFTQGKKTFTFNALS